MFICDLCNKILSTKSNLDRHKNRKISCVIEIDNLKDCKICNIKFNHKSRLLTHNMTKKHILKYNELIKLEDNKISDVSNIVNIKFAEMKNTLENELNEMKDTIAMLRQEKSSSYPAFEAKPETTHFLAMNETKHLKISIK